MAISFVALSGAAISSTISYPAGIIAGDLLVLITSGSNAPATTPTGWYFVSAQGSGQFITVFYTFATGTESGTVTTGSLGGGARSAMLAYRGAGIINAVSTYNTGTGTSATTNTLTTTFANDYVVSCFVGDNTSTYSFTPQAGYTVRLNAAASSSVNGMVLGDELQAAAGTSTSRAVTISASQPWNTVAIALVPDRTVYWVGGNGTWDATTTTNWASSSGGASGVPAPTPVDNAIVDSNSGSPTITLSGAPLCASLTTTGATCTLASTGTLSVSGSMTLSNTTTWSATGLLTFNKTGTITANAVTINSPVTFFTAAQTFTLGSNLTVSSTLTTTFTSGTLSLSTFTLTTGFFNSNNANTRVLAFGTGNITVNGAGGTLWDMTTITSFSYTGTPTVNISNNSAAATTIATGALVEATALNFNYTTGTYTLSDASAVYKTLNFTGFAGTVSNQTRTIYGGFTVPASGVTLTAGTFTTTFANTSGTFSITTNGVTLDFPVTKAGIGGTVQLAGNLTLGATRTFTLLSGTLNLNNLTLTSGSFVSTGVTTRSITFGTTGVITVNGAGGAIFTTTSSLTFTGTSTVNISNNSAVATTVSSAVSAFNINYTTGTYTLTDTGTVYNNINFTGFAGTVANGTRTVAGNWTNPVGVVFTGGALVTTFNVATITQTITNNGILFDFPITKTGTSVLQLTGDLTLGFTRQFNLDQGTLTLNDFTLSTGTFTSTGANTRSIAFGTTGALTCTGAGGTLYNTNGSITFSGTSKVNISNNTSAATTVTIGASVNINYTTGTYTLTDANALYSNVNFTGFAGTVSNQVRTVIGNWTNPASGITFAAGASATSFNGTGTQTIVNNGVAFDFNMRRDSGAGTLQLSENLTLGSTRNFNLGVGTLDLNNFILTAGLFDASGVGNRTLAFGTSGTITCIGTGTVWNTGTITSFTITGTSTINISNNSATATTVTTGSTFLNFNYTTGTYTLTDTNANYTNVNFTGFAGTVSNQTRSVRGNWTNPASGITWTAGTNALTFSGNTGTQTVTTNNVTFDFPVSKTGTSTLALGSSLTLGSTRNFAVSAGTFTAGVYSITAGSFSLTAGTINMGSGTWTAATTGTSWSVTGPTINAETSTIVLSENTTAAKTFAGGSKTYYNLQIGGVTANAIATYTITGTNTFNIISSTKTVASTITIPVSVTTTVAGWTANGSLGNLIIVKTPTNGTAGTLASTTGNITAIVPRYVSFQDIVFAPLSPSERVRWYLGSTITFVSNVTGNYLLTDRTNQIYYVLTTGTSWTVPSDFDSTNNDIYIIGGGAGGGGAIATGTSGNKVGGGGGGGGGFTGISNLSLTPSSSVSYAIGAGGTGLAGATSSPYGPSGSGGTTTFSSYSAGGGSGTLTTLSTTSPGGVGGTGLTYNGGTGGTAPFGNNATNGGGGGGGSGGVDGAGVNGTNATSAGGAGGAGDNNVSLYINLSSALYGRGGTGASGSSGTAASPTGYGGGGGGGSTNSASPGRAASSAGSQGIVVIRYSVPILADSTENSSIADINEVAFSFDGFLTEDSVLDAFDASVFNYNGDLIEDLFILDVEDAQANYNLDITEDATLEDSESTTSTFNPVVVEDATLENSETAQASFNPEIIEPVIVEDISNFSVTISVSITEPLTSEDIASVFKTFVSTITEDSVFADLPDFVSAVAVSITEGFTSEETQSVVFGYTVNITENLTSAEVETATQTVVSTITEAFTSADISETTIAFYVLANENNTLNDTQTAVNAFSDVISENLTSGSSVIAVFAPNGVVIEGFRSAETIDTVANNNCFMLENLLLLDVTKGYGWFTNTTTQDPAFVPNTVEQTPNWTPNIDVSPDPGWTDN